MDLKTRHERDEPVRAFSSGPADIATEPHYGDMREDAEVDFPFHVRPDSGATGRSAILPNPSRRAHYERSDEPLPDTERHASAMASMKTLVAASDWRDGTDQLVGKVPIGCVIQLYVRRALAPACNAVAESSAQQPPVIVKVQRGSCARRMSSFTNSQLTRPPRKRLCRGRTSENKSRDRQTCTECHLHAAPV